MSIHIKRRPKASFLLLGVRANRLEAIPPSRLAPPQSDRGDGGDMGIPVQ